MSKLFKLQNQYKNIDGDYTSKIPIGYCQYHLHKGYLTFHEFKTHKCIEKHCKLLILNPKHPEYKKYITNKNVKKDFMDLINSQLQNGTINKYKYSNLCNFTTEQQVSYLNNVENNKKQLEKYNPVVEIKQQVSIWQKIKNFFHFGGKK